MEAALTVVDADAPPASLDGIFRRYARYVAGVALRLLGRDDEVDDLIQDVFLDAVRGLRGLRDPEAIRGWLATVTVRRARRRLRVRRLRALLGLDRAPTYESLAAPGATAEERALLARVYAVLDGMPVDLRVAWALRHVAGERLDAVARACGCSLATAKRRIAAAQRILDGELRDE